MSKLPLHWQNFVTRLNKCVDNTHRLTNLEREFVLDMERKYDNAVMAKEVMEKRHTSEASLDSYFSPTAKQLNWLSQIADKL